MQEFSSVTASSYDAESLAPLLSEKSAEGWDVISIVAAGTNIVAYLRRDVSDEDTGEIDTSSFGDDTADTADAAVPGFVETEVVEADTAGGVEELAEIQAVDEEIAVPSDPTPVPATTVIESGTSAEAVDEPAGWGAAPEQDAGTESATTDTASEPSVEDLAAQVAEPEPEIAPVVPVVEAAPVVEPEPAPVVEPEPEPVVEAAPAVESTVPAGWYADPSGRYELRYWDGTAWTEHVSRAGQQFTDPPVA